MSRIAVTTLGTLGHLHPMISIALELRQRGHDVVFVTHEVYQLKLQALGFEFHSIRPDFTAMNGKVIRQGYWLRDNEMSDSI